MDKRVSLISSVLVFLIAACSTNQPVTTITDLKKDTKENFNAKSIPEPESTGLPLDLSKISEPPPIPKNIPKSENYETNKMKAPSFDHVPPYDPKNIVPGSITVIFKNDSKIRFDKINNRFNSKYDSYTKDLEDILLNKKFIGQSDLSLKGETEESLEGIQKQVQKKSLTEIPNFKSVQYLKFDNETDTKSIADKLLKLPFVRSAYPSVRMKPSTIIPYYKVPEAGSTSNIKSSIIPVDTAFGSSEELNWWWFNKYKVFEGWKVYASAFGVSLDNQASQMNGSNSLIKKPILAVIDDGFDTGVNTYNTTNSPNYLTGVSLKSTSSGVIETIGGSTETSSSWSESHGARVSSIIASKTGNSGSNSDLAGIIPGATILPIRLEDFNNETVAYAIRYAADYNPGANSSIDSINLSISRPYNGVDSPIITEPGVAVSIWYATNGYDNNNGYQYSRDKNVIIISGNGYNNDLDSVITSCPTKGSGSSIHPQNFKYSYPDCWDYGQITVGGGNKEGTNTPFPTGSLIDLVAGAAQITSTTYNTTTKARIFNAADGTSVAAPMVSATVSMMRRIAQHRGITLNSEQIRDILIFTSTLSFDPNTSTSMTNNKFRGKYLYDQSRNLPFRQTSLGTSSVDQFAQARELNVFNALSFVKNYIDGCTIIRLFNTDDLIEATTDSWANHFGYETYYTDTLFRFAPGAIPNGQVIAFDAKNNGGNGSYGYQVYKNGYLSKEYIKGVVTVYKPWLPNYLSYPSYNTVGTNSASWFGGQYYTF